MDEMNKKNRPMYDHDHGQVKQLDLVDVCLQAEQDLLKRKRIEEGKLLINCGLRDQIKRAITIKNQLDRRNKKHFQTE